MNQDLVARLSKLRTELQSLIADVIDAHGENNEAVMALNEADDNLDTAENASVNSPLPRNAFAPFPV